MKLRPSRYCLLLFMLLLLPACAPAVQVTVAPGFKPAPDQDTVYVVPFVTTMVPANFSDTVFDSFIDDLNDQHNRTSVKWFAIIKEDLKNVDKTWLAHQVYITGEIWSYIENSGCCSTELRVKARIKVFEPGKTKPSMDVFVPLETFFDHDMTTVEAERDKLAKRLAAEMSKAVITAFATSHR